MKKFTLQKDRFYTENTLHKNVETRPEVEAEKGRGITHKSWSDKEILFIVPWSLASSLSQARFLSLNTFETSWSNKDRPRLPSLGLEPWPEKLS